MKHFILVAMVLAAVACGAPEATEGEGGSADVERGVQGGKGGSCPTSLDCAFQPTHPQFMYAQNSAGGPLDCHWRQSGFPYGTLKVSMTKPAGCTTCCASPYCPDPKYGQQVFNTHWTCKAS